MLVVKNLKVNYGKIEAIKDVSFEVPDGKIVTLIGANGAGKTTTLRALSGLEKTSGGSIVLDGMDITNREAHKMVPLGISHVPEGRKIFPTLTVRENLELAGWTIKDKKLVRERIEEVFELFPRIKERASQLGGTLSGGEQQMLAIGRALMAKPRMLLLDEPSMGLAPLIVREILGMIAQLRKTLGLTVLLVEQNARSALRIADSGYVLETGRVLVQGTAEDLLANRDVQRAYLGRDAE